MPRSSRRTANTEALPCSKQPDVVQVAVPLFRNHRLEDEHRLDFGPAWNSNDVTTDAEWRIMRDIERCKVKMDDRYKEIHRQKRGMKQDLDRIKKLRVKLFKARSHRAPMRRLPPEVLRMIFEMGAVVMGPQASVCNRLALGRELEPAYQVSCSQVCQDWRQVALDSSYLWSRYCLQGDRRTFRFVEGIIASRRDVAFSLLLDLFCYSPQSRAALTFLKRTAKFLRVHGHKVTSLITAVCNHEDTFLFGSAQFPLRQLGAMKVVGKVDCLRSHDASQIQAKRWAERRTVGRSYIHDFGIAIRDDKHIPSITTCQWLHSFSGLTTLRLEVTHSMSPNERLEVTGLNFCDLRRLYVDNFMLPWLLNCTTVLSTVNHVVLRVKKGLAPTEVSLFGTFFCRIPNVRELFCDATYDESTRWLEDGQAAPKDGEILLEPVLHALIEFDPEDSIPLPCLHTISFRVDNPVPPQNPQTFDSETIGCLLQLAQVRGTCSISLQGVDVRVPASVTGDEARVFQEMVSLGDSTEWPAQLVSPYRERVKQNFEAFHPGT